MASHFHKTFLLLSLFPLIFFTLGHAKCVPRNASSPSPTPDTPSNLQPVSSPKSPSPPTPSSPSPPPPTPSPPKESQPQPVPSFPRHPFLRRSNMFPAAAQQINNNMNAGIKKICDSTDYPDICMGTLSPLVRNPGDVPAVLNVAIKAGLDFAKTALTAADKLATKPGTPPNMASMYKDCKDSYDDAVYNFQNAMDAGSSDLGTTNTMLSAAITDVGDCEDACQGPGCQLATFSDKVTKMASNCLAIASLIH